jgi:hypothetical protein
VNLVLFVDSKLTELTKFVNISIHITLYKSLLIIIIFRVEVAVGVGVGVGVGVVLSINLIIGTINISWLNINY